MPRTPCAPRPIGRTSFSSKRTALPPELNSMMSCLPSVNATPIREAQNVVVGVGDEHPVDEIVFLRRSRLLAASAAPLRAVFTDGLRLHVAAMRHRNDHVCGRNQVLDRQVDALRDDLGTALVAELLANALELVVNDLRHATRLGQDVE